MGGRGRIVVNGKVSSFLVGGQELVIDYLCLSGPGTHIVELDPGRAAELAAAIEPCFTIEPLRPRTSPLRYVASPAARATRSDEITALVDSISRDRLEHILEKLVSFHTRESSSADYREAASWVAEQLEGIGLAVTVSQVAIPDGAQDSQNVEAVRAGAGDAPQILMATAHLDSVNHENAGPAPGADDNASGSAGLLELARVLEGQAETIASDQASVCTAQEA